MNDKTFADQVREAAEVVDKATQRRRDQASNPFSEKPPSFWSGADLRAAATRWQHEDEQSDLKRQIVDLLLYKTNTIYSYAAIAAQGLLDTFDITLKDGK